MALLQIAEPGLSTAPHQHRLAIGIDLGTTNSLVATVRNSVATVLNDEVGRPLLPSVVHYGRDGRVDVGYSAQSRQSDDPHNTVVSVKRFMGRGLKDISGHDSLPYQFIDSPGMLQLKTVAGPKSPVEVSADILRGRFRADPTRAQPVAAGEPGQSGTVSVVPLDAAGKPAGPAKAVATHKDIVYAVAVSEDGTRLATAGYDRVIQVFELAPDGGAKPVHTLRDHSDTIFALAFQPGGRLLASAAGDRDVLVPFGRQHLEDEAKAHVEPLPRRFVPVEDHDVRARSAARHLTAPLDRLAAKAEQISFIGADQTADVGIGQRDKRDLLVGGEVREVDRVGAV